MNLKIKDYKKIVKGIVNKDYNVSLDRLSLQ